MGVQGVFNKKATHVYIAPDPGRHVHPRHKRDPRYAIEAEQRRKARRRSRRKAQ